MTQLFDLRSIDPESFRQQLVEKQQAAQVPDSKDLTSHKLESREPGLLEKGLNFLGVERHTLTPAQVGRAAVEVTARDRGEPVSQFREGSSFMEQAAGNFVDAYSLGTLGAISEAVTGDPLVHPTDKEDTLGQVGAGAGQLGGFILGLGGKTASTTTQALLPKPGWAPRYGKVLDNVIAHTLGLGLGTMVQSTGEVLKQGDVKSVAKTLFTSGAHGAGMGTVFGFAGMIPNQPVRLAVGMAGLTGLRTATGEMPQFVDRPWGQIAFDVGMDMFFLWGYHGKAQKQLYENALTKLMREEKLTTEEHSILRHARNEMRAKHPDGALGILKEKVFGSKQILPETKQKINEQYEALRRNDETMAKLESQISEVQKLIDAGDFEAASVFANGKPAVKKNKKKGLEGQDAVKPGIEDRRTREYANFLIEFHRENPEWYRAFGTDKPAEQRVANQQQIDSMFPREEVSLPQPQVGEKLEVTSQDARARYEAVQRERQNRESVEHRNRVEGLRKQLAQNMKKKGVEPVKETPKPDVLIADTKKESKPDKVADIKDLRLRKTITEIKEGIESDNLHSLALDQIRKGFQAAEKNPDVSGVWPNDPAGLINKMSGGLILEGLKPGEIKTPNTGKESKTLRSENERSNLEVREASKTEAPKEYGPLADKELMQDVNQTLAESKRLSESLAKNIESVRKEGKTADLVQPVESLSVETEATRAVNDLKMRLKKERKRRIDEVIEEGISPEQAYEQVLRNIKDDPKSTKYQREKAEELLKEQGLLEPPEPVYIPKTDRVELLQRAFERHQTEPKSRESLTKQEAELVKLLQETNPEDFPGSESDFGLFTDHTTRLLGEVRKEKLRHMQVTGPEGAPTPVVAKPDPFEGMRKEEVIAKTEPEVIGDVTIYHKTTPENAKLIREQGFREFTIFDTVDRAIKMLGLDGKNKDKYIDFLKDNYLDPDASIGRKVPVFFTASESRLHSDVVPSEALLNVLNAIKHVEKGKVKKSAAALEKAIEFGGEEIIQLKVPAGRLKTLSGKPYSEQTKGADFTLTAEEANRFLGIKEVKRDAAGEMLITKPNGEAFGSERFAYAWMERFDIKGEVIKDPMEGGYVIKAKTVGKPIPKELPMEEKLGFLKHLVETFKSEGGYVPLEGTGLFDRLKVHLRDQINRAKDAITIEDRADKLSTAYKSVFGMVDDTRKFMNASVITARQLGQHLEKALPNGKEREGLAYWLDNPHESLTNRGAGEYLRALMTHYKGELKRHKVMDEFVDHYYSHVITGSNKPEHEATNLLNAFMKKRKRKDDGSFFSLKELENMGFTVQKDIAKVIPAYAMAAEHAIAKKIFADNLIDMKSPNGNPVVISAHRTKAIPGKTIQREYNGDTYIVMDNDHRFRSWARVNSKRLGEGLGKTGRKDLFEGNNKTAVLKDVYLTLDALWPDAPSYLARRAAGFRAGVKRLKMLNPLIHGTNIESQIMMAAGVDYFQRFQKWTPEEHNHWEMLAAQHGVELIGLYDIKQHLLDNMDTTKYSLKKPPSPKEILQDPMLGLARPIKTLTSLADSVLWDHWVKPGQLLLFKIHYEKGQRKGLSPEEAGHSAAALVNDFMGTMPRNWFTKSQARWLSILMFARNWNVGLTRTVTGMSKTLATSKYTPTPLRFEGFNDKQMKYMSNEYRKSLVTGAIGVIAMQNILQAMFLAANGEEHHFTWQNPENRWLDVDTGLYDDKGRIYLKPFFFRQMDDYYKVGSGRGMQSLENKAEPVLNGIIELIKNVSFAGPLFDPGMTGFQKARTAAQHIGETLLPLNLIADRRNEIRQVEEAAALLAGSHVGHSKAPGRLQDLLTDMYKFSAKQKYQNEEFTAQLKYLIHSGRENEAVQMAVRGMEEGMFSPEKFKNIVKGIERPILYHFIMRKREFRDYYGSLNEKKQGEVMELLDGLLAESTQGRSGKLKPTSELPWGGGGRSSGAPQVSPNPSAPPVVSGKGDVANMVEELKRRRGVK